MPGISHHTAAGTVKKFFLLVTVCAAVLIVLLGSFLIAVNTRYAQNAAKVMIGRMIPGSITWEKLTVDPAGGFVTIHKAVLSGADGKTIISFRHLAAEISIHDLFLGRLVVHKAVLDRPAVDFSIDRHGSFNLLAALGIKKKKVHTGRKKRSAVPDFLAVERLVLSDGSARWTRPAAGTIAGIDGISLSAGLDFKERTGNLSLKTASGFFTRKGRSMTLTHLGASAVMKRGAIDPVTVEIRTQGSRLVVSGTIGDVFTAPRFDVAASFTVSLSELSTVLLAPGTMDGGADGSLSIRGPLNNPSALLKCVYTGGTIYGRRVDRVTLDMRLDDRVLSLPALSALAGGGACSVSGTMDFREAFPGGFLSVNRNPDMITCRVSAVLARFPLAAFPAAGGTLRGALNSKMSASITGLDPLPVSATFNIDAAADNFSWKESAAAAPLSLSLGGLLEGGCLRIESLKAGFGNMRMSGAGYLKRTTREVSASVSISSGDLSREGAVLGMNLQGAAKIDGVLSGTLRAPAAFLHFHGERLRYGDVTLGDASLEASLDSGGTMNMSRFSLVNRSSEIDISGSSRLYRAGAGGTGGGRPLSLNIRRFDINLADFRDSMAGRVTLGGAVSGSVEKPLGSVRLSAGDMDLGFQKFSAINIEARMSGGNIYINPCTIDFAPGEAARADGMITTKGAYRFTMAIDALTLGRTPLLKSAGLDGNLSMMLSGEGTMGNPRAKGTITIRQPRYGDRAFDDFLVNISIADRMIRVNGKLNFDCAGYYDVAGRNFRIALNFNRTDLSPFLSAAGNPGLNAMITGAVTASGNTRRLPGMELSADISKFEVFSGTRELIRAKALRATVRNSVLSLPPATITLLDSGWIRLSGSGPIQRAVVIDSEGVIPAEIAGWFNNYLTNASGLVRFTTSLRGDIRRPVLNAGITLQDIGFDMPYAENGIRGLSGAITVAPGLVTITGVRGSLGRGTIGLKGHIGMRGLSPMNAALNFEANNAGISVPDMLDLDFNARLNLSGTRDRAFVRGDVTILRGLYYQDLVVHPFRDILKREKAVKRNAEGEKSFLDRIRLDIALVNRNPFEIDNNIARLTINNNLRFFGTAAHPVLNGTLRVETGSLFYLGKEFAISSGKIDFLNPYRTDPVMDIRGSSQIQNWNVLVGLSGRPDDLKFDLSSQPVLDSSDILSLILIGKTKGGKSSLSAGQLISQALALTYGDEIKKKTGIDSIGITTPAEKGKNTSRNYSATIGKSINDRITYYQTIGKDEGGVKTSTTIEYKVFDTILIDSLYDSTGKIGGGVRYSRSFR
jgi:translocation and assembly module TamB